MWLIQPEFRVWTLSFVRSNITIRTFHVSLASVYFCTSVPSSFLPENTSLTSVQMSKLTTLRLQDANSLKEIQFLGYYNFWTVCLLKTIQFIFLCVLPVISADWEEACLIVCVQYVITLSSGSETSLIICLHKFQTNWQRSRHTRAPDGHVCASQTPHHRKYLLYGWIYQVTMKEQDKGWQAY